MRLHERLRHFAWDAFLPAIILAIGGVLLVRYADFGHEKRDGLTLGDRQSLSLVVSLGVMAIVLVPSYMRLRRLTVAIYGILVMLTLYATFFGAMRNNARRWIALGFGDLTPSEFLKIGVVIVLARLLMYRRNVREFRSILLPFAVALLPAAIVAKQPDLGTALLFVPIPFALLYAAGAKWQHLALCGALFVAIGGLAIGVGVEAGLLKPYQMERIEAFFARAKKDPREAAGGQASAGIEAIGAGGLAGCGSGEWTRTVVARIPERHSDFIFAVAGAKLGLLGTTAIVGLYAALILALVRVAARTREPFGRLIVVGAATLLVTQTVVNLGMTTGCLPVTGLPLPFVSCGGSSLLSTFVCLGLALNVSMRRVHVIAKEDFN
ncbi:MAG: rod shape-determining protein RodA [Planctomycetes bacterium]|nr:rod shape-determining protein RodA [Planctomycetota bacterium]MBI3846948.1 rod shape-determining protein RodA [Planctomycetota bacterium]